MQTTTVTCNICGKILGTNTYNSIRLNPEFRPLIHGEYINGYLDVDLCKECTQKLLKILNAEPNYFEQERQKF